MAATVLVIGAGISGLAAAHHLQANGYKVGILEARNRIGGRIWTENLATHIADLGAAWIHFANKKHPIYQLAQQLGLVTKLSSFSRYKIVDEQGKRTNAKKFYAMLQQLSLCKEREMIEKYLAPLPQDISLQKGILAILEILSKESTDLEQLKTQLVHKKDWDLFNLLYESYYATELDKISLQSVLDDNSELIGKDYWLVSGYQAIIHHLAANTEIILGEEVQSITQNSVVNVQTKNNTYTADFVVCTLPLGVLQKEKVQFSPKLPTAKTQAIQDLQQGVLDKIVIAFKEQKWQSNYEVLVNVPTQNDLFKISFWHNHSHLEQGNTILCAYVAGEEALKMEQLTDEVILTNALQQLQRALPSLEKDDILSYKITRWGQDTHSYGSYLYLPVGVSYQSILDLAAPFGRIFFAGEATILHDYSYAHGAYWSGIRAAKEVMAAPPTENFRKD
jgi:monoamine oxidase